MTTQQDAVFDNAKRRAILDFMTKFAEAHPVEYTGLGTGQLEAFDTWWRRIGLEPAFRREGYSEQDLEDAGKAGDLEAFLFGIYEQQINARRPQPIAPVPTATTPAVLEPQVVALFNATDALKVGKQLISNPMTWVGVLGTVVAWPIGVLRFLPTIGAIALQIYGNKKQGE